MKNKKLVGIFQNESEAVKAIENLKAVGYGDNEISVIAKNRDESLDRIEDATNADVADSDADSKAAGGAVIGGALGGIGALLLELGVFAIPGVGPFLAAGPIAATIGGLVAGGAVGGIVGALVDIGIDEEDAKEYETYLDRGDILVAVDDRDDFDRNKVFDSYYENNSVIRDRYDRNKRDII